MALLRRIWPFLVLVLLPVIPLWRTLLGEAIGPYGQIATMVPGSTPKGPNLPWDVLQADSILQFAVWRDLVLDAWHHGQVPGWNPYQLGGTPLLANSQSGGLYPPHILLGVLGTPTATAITLLAWFHLALAGLGVSALVMRLGGVKTGAVLAGASFALSPFMLAWTSLGSVISTVAWIPWALVGLTYCNDEEADRGGVGRVGFPVGMMLLAGHLQFSAYGLFAILLFGAWQLPLKRQFRAFWAPALGLFLGACIAAPQLAPVLSYSQFSHRRNVASEEGYQAYAASAIQPAALATMPIPTLDGNPREMVSEQLPISTYAPKLSQQGANLAEQAVGVGPLVLLLVVIALGTLPKRHPAWALAATSLIALLVAFGTPINRIAYFGVPGWSSTGSPGRMVCLLVLSFSVLAGLAASEWMRGNVSAEKAKRLLAIGLAAMLLPIAMSSQLAPMQGLDPKTFDAIRSAGMASALPAGLGLAILSLGFLFWSSKEHTARTKGGFIALPVLSAIAFGAMALVPTGSPDLNLAEKPTGRIAVVNSMWDLNLTPKATMPPNLASLFRVEDIAGYDSLLHRDTVAMMKEINGGQDAAPPQNGNMMFVKTPDLDQLKAAGVTEVWGLAPSSDPRLKELPPVDGKVPRAQVVGSMIADVDGKPASVIKKSYQGFTVTVPGPGHLTVRYRNIPGWAVTIDKKPVPISEGRWLELTVPDKATEVEFRYQPSGMFLPMGILAFLVSIFATLQPRRKPVEAAVAEPTPEPVG